MSKERDYLPEGTVLKGRFKIVKHLSSGRNSNLYIVEDRKRFDFWVIKELISKFSNPIEAKQAYQQFELQAKILNRLDHPQLPKVEDFFEESSRHFLVMEYIDGKSLDEVVKEGEDFFPEEKIISWAIQLCEVLYYLHSQKPHPIIFRDLKPENLILTKEDAVKLVNFGISKIFDPHSRTLAVAKTISPHFSPIEQYAMVTDARSDIYSLGATLYYIATKSLPIDAIDRSMNNVPLKFCREFNKSISLELEGVILKAMELDKEDRYQSAEEMMADLKKIEASCRTLDVSEHLTSGVSSIQTIDPDQIKELSKQTIVIPDEKIETPPTISVDRAIKEEVKKDEVLESEEESQTESSEEEKDLSQKKKKLKKKKKKSKKKKKEEEAKGGNIWGYIVVLLVVLALLIALVYVVVFFILPKLTEDSFFGLYKIICFLVNTLC